MTLTQAGILTYTLNVFKYNRKGMRNPLIGPILHILKKHPEGIGEFEILQALKTQLPELKKIAKNANLLLFRQHFLIMNALYQLQFSLRQEGRLSLTISPMHIQLFSSKLTPLATRQDIGSHGEAKLAAYYLDWKEYEKTDEEDVSQLLASFYTRIYLNDDRDAALETLQIFHKSPSKEEIKRQYRKLAHQAHPDHGGNTETFISLRQAYECLLL